MSVLYVLGSQQILCSEYHRFAFKSLITQLRSIVFGICFVLSPSDSFLGPGVFGFPRPKLSWGSFFLGHVLPCICSSC